MYVRTVTFLLLYLQLPSWWIRIHYIGDDDVMILPWQYEKWSVHICRGCGWVVTQWLDSFPAIIYLVYRYRLCSITRYTLPANSNAWDIHNLRSFPMGLFWGNVIRPLLFLIASLSGEVFQAKHLSRCPIAPADGCWWWFHHRLVGIVWTRCGRQVLRTFANRQTKWLSWS